MDETAGDPQLRARSSVPTAIREDTADRRQNGAGGRAVGAGMGMGGGMGGGGGAAPMSLRNLRTFSSFRNPVYRLFYASMLGQMGAMNMEMMARGLLVYRLTGSAFALGLIALAQSVPMLLFSLFGGVLADRVQKKHVLMVGQGVSGVVVLGVAIALSTGFLREGYAGALWVLLGASVIKGTAQGLMMPSRQALLGEVVSEEQLMNAVALNNFGQNMFRLLAPALAGFLIAFFGFASTYYTMTAMYAIAVFFVVLMPRTGTMSIRGRGALGEIKDGIRYVRHDALIGMILIVTLLTVLLSMPYMTLLPVFSEKVLDVGASGLGILISVSGVGALIGSIILASLPNKRRGAMLMVGSLILGVALVGFAFSSSWYLSLALIVFVGLGQTARMTLSNTLLMYYVPDQYRGRVMSIYMMEFGLTSFSVFFAALVADAVGVQWSVGGLAMVLVILSIVVLLFVPRLRRLD